MARIKDYLSIAFIVLIIGGFFYVKTMISNYEKEIIDLKTEKVKELKIQRTAIKLERDSIINLQVVKYDSLLKVKQKIKYIPYEKPIYVNRTLDESLNVLSDYTYKRTSKKN